MKTKHAFFVLCFLSSFATAGEIEEVKVVARPFRIVLEHIQLHHKQNPITGNWYYVEAKQQQDTKKKEDSE